MTADTRVLGREGGPEMLSAAERASFHLDPGNWTDDGVALLACLSSPSITASVLPFFLLSRFLYPCSLNNGNLAAVTLKQFAWGEKEEKLPLASQKIKIQGIVSQSI